ncbi:MAG: TetR/AcrR family transcriptional regulator, partial [Candidatus Omnitrophica bacterium]|nr:TetR/AcrR family transcriptional regulator [Candidatus Omnitrophota bacterium]
MTIAETRERILDASSQAIIAKSYNGVGLKKILKNAGVPKGSFYHHFKSKEDLAIKKKKKS